MTLASVSEIQTKSVEFGIVIFALVFNTSYPRHLFCFFFVYNIDSWLIPGDYYPPPPLHKNIFYLESIRFLQFDRI